MILSLLGKNPELVKGVAEYSKEGIDVLAAVIMQFENGVRASFSCGMNFEADAGYGIRSDWVLKIALFLHV